MKVGIVVPYSWSFWGGVVEHTDHQARALQELGVETRTIIGHDPPGRLTQVLHPRSGRHGQLPPDVIPVGRSVIVPANHSLPNIVLAPATMRRIRRVLERERFDILHLHEPMTPAICVATLSIARVPMVATFHASGELGWMKGGRWIWGFLMDRLDGRIAVSEQAKASAARWLPGDYEIIPNGVVIPESASAGDREHKFVFIGRQEQRKGLPILLRAWPEVYRQTGARLRLIGAEPLAVRLLMHRNHFSEEGVDVLGIVSEEVLTAELSSARALVAPSLGGESFGMVLTRAYACATPVVASDIPGYREVFDESAGIAFPPGDHEALARAMIEIVGDEERRRRLGESGRKLASERYDWRDVGRRLLDFYERTIEQVRAREREQARAASA